MMDEQDRRDFRDMVAEFNARDQRRDVALFIAVIIVILLAGSLLVHFVVTERNAALDRDADRERDQTIIDLGDDLANVATELAGIVDATRPQLHVIQPTEQSVSLVTRESVLIEDVRFCFTPQVERVKVDALFFGVEILDPNWPGRTRNYSAFGGTFFAGVDHEWLPFDENHCITIESYTQLYPPELLEDLESYPSLTPLVQIGGVTRATDLSSEIPVTGAPISGQTEEFRIPVA